MEEDSLIIALKEFRFKKKKERNDLNEVKEYYRLFLYADADGNKIILELDAENLFMSLVQVYVRRKRYEITKTILPQKMTVERLSSLMKAIL